MTNISPTSFKQNFDMVSPECDDPDQKMLWGVLMPPFVSDKVVNWMEENFQEPLIEFKGLSCVKKVKNNKFPE
jgi:myotubularin-related protein 6/7/8